MFFFFPCPCSLLYSFPSDGLLESKNKNLNFKGPFRLIKLMPNGISYGVSKSLCCVPNSSKLHMIHAHIWMNLKKLRKLFKDTVIF